MKVFTYSEARQRLADVLNIARTEEGVIKRRGGEIFSIIYRKSVKSPFDVPGIKTKATTKTFLRRLENQENGLPSKRSKIDAQTFRGFNNLIILKGGFP